MCVWSRDCHMASELWCKAWTIVIMWLRRRAFRRGSTEQYNLNSKLFIGSLLVKLLLGIESTAFDSFECMITFCVWPLAGFVFLYRGLGWGLGVGGSGGQGGYVDQLNYVWVLNLLLLSVWYVRFCVWPSEGFVLGVGWWWWWLGGGGVARGAGGYVGQRTYHVKWILGHRLNSASVKPCPLRAYQNSQSAFLISESLLFLKDQDIQSNLVATCATKNFHECNVNTWSCVLCQHPILIWKLVFFLFLGDTADVWDDFQK